MHTRLDFVDSLRGWAIIGVVSVHVALLCPGMSPTFSSLALYGTRGVQLFFILSAFTIFTITHGRPLVIFPFFIRRIFRIAPLFYFAGIFYVIFNQIFPNLSSEASIGFKQIALTIFFLHGYSIDSFNAIVPGGWSISCEVSFYIVFPFIQYFVTNERRAFCFFVLSILVALLWQVTAKKIFSNDDPDLLGSYISFSFLYNLPSFAAGIGLYFVVNSHQVNINIGIRACRLIGLTALLILAVIAIQNLRNPLYSSLLIPFLVYVTCRLRPNIIVNFPMKYVGVHSYSIYIVHFAILDGISALWSDGSLGNFRFLELFVFTLALSSLVSAATYRWIERPFIAIGRRISDRQSFRFRKVAEGG